MASAADSLCGSLGANLAQCHTLYKTQKDVIETSVESITASVESITASVQSIGASVLSISEPNATCAAFANIAMELNVLKGRQAASAALQVIQFLLFAGYLITLAVNYVVKKCKKHSKKRGEEEVELLEQKLQERKSRRRAAARQSSADK